MSDKILIFGKGQIGNFYQNYFSAQEILSQISQADITDPAQISSAISQYSPTVAINTAAKTNLEWCSQNRLEAFNVNVLGADNLAHACDQNHIYFVHFSSGCIFQSQDETDVKKETDTPNPAAFYSWTKVWSEQLVAFNRSSDFQYLILRPRQPISSQVSPKNMLIKMLTFTKFIDTPNTGTVIEDLMDWTKILIEKRATGIVHVANEGWLTPYDIGLLLKKHILPSLPVEKISKAELDRLTPNRRVDTVLDVSRLKSFGANVVAYRQRIEEVIIDLKKNLDQADKNNLGQILEDTAAASRQRTVVNSCYSTLFQ
jgi:dTDP-4-dehydrorhamnose reductase